MKKHMFIILMAILASTANAAAPNIDTFFVQSYLKLSNGQPLADTSGSFVFAVFQNGTCIWAQRALAVSIANGVINQSLTGNGSNISSISNSNATAGECVANFSGIILNSALLNSSSSGRMNIRIYAESTLTSGTKPIWDIPIAASPTAMIADLANSATTANNLVPSKQTVGPTSSADAGKFPVLNASGQLDNTMINQSGLSIANTQVSGLGTAAVKNTGTTSGTIPLLGAGGLLSSTLMPTYTANQIMTTNASGQIGTGYNATSVGGAGTSGYIPLLNGSGQLATAMINYSAANITGILNVSQGGTGVNTIPANGLVVGNGTSAVTTVSPGANLNILVSNGTSWVSGSPSSNNIVDMSSAQASIGGNKTFTGTTGLSTTNITGVATLSGATTSVTSATSFSATSPSVTLGHASSASTINVGTGTGTNTVKIGTGNAASTVQIGNAGTALSNIILCSMGSAAVTTNAVTTVTGACAGVTIASVVQCSPTVAPNNTTSTFYVLTAYPTNGAVNINIAPRNNPGAWTTGWNCFAMN